MAARNRPLRRVLEQRLYPLHVRRRVVRRVLLLVACIWLLGAGYAALDTFATAPNRTARLYLALGFGPLGPFLPFERLPPRLVLPAQRWGPLAMLGAVLLGAAALAQTPRTTRGQALLRAARHALTQGRLPPAMVARHLRLRALGVPLARCGGRVVGLEWGGDHGHIAVIAPTRSGKGLHLTHTLLQWPRGAVVVDPKGEQWHRTAATRAQHMGPVYRVPPHGLDLLHYFDPTSDLDLQELHKHLLRSWQDTDPIFAEKSLALFRAAVTAGRATSLHPLHILAAWTEQSPQTALAWAADFAPEAVKQFLDGDPVSKPNRFSLTAWGVFTSRLGPLVPHQDTWTNGDIPQDWAQQQATIYLCYPLEQLDAASGLIAALLAGLLRRQLYARTRVPTLFALDELPTIGLHNLSTYLATVGGAGVTVLFYAQAMTQLEERYGPAAARSILSNCHHQLYYPPRDPQTAKYISDLFGTTVETHSSSGARGQVLLRELIRPALDVAEITALPEEVVVALSTRAGRQYRFLGERLNIVPLLPYLDPPPPTLPLHV